MGAVWMRASGATAIATGPGVLPTRVQIATALRSE